MKKRILAISLMLIALSILTLSCKKDKTSASNEPETPTYYEEPENVVTVNLLNDDGSYVLILGRYIKISTANNFYTIYGNGAYLTFNDVGEVASLGYAYQIPQDGWSEQVAVFPGHGYVLKKVEYDNYGYVYTKYARVYVVDYIYDANNEIIGAQIEYQDNWCFGIDVYTYSVTDVTATSAVISGFVEFADNTIKKRGFCWSKENYYPTIEDSHVSTNENTNDFTLEITGLEASTNYYVRAYVESPRFGVVYGNQLMFTTLDNPGVATVRTSYVTNITETTAKCYGNIEDLGGDSIIDLGACWGTSPNPTIDGAHQSTDSGMWEFSVEMSGLNAGVTYYVRAYATNNYGTAYGEDVVFITDVPGPEGAIVSAFSVSATQKVYFSKGNLQYQASTDTWRFAENQRDFVGESNSNISPSYDGWIDLFGWGTGQDPTKYSNSDDYNEYNEWGDNQIINGENTNNLWRTMTSGEWWYLFYQRNTPSGVRFAKAKVDNVCGIILLPDDWDLNSGLYGVNSESVSYTYNVIGATEWMDRFESKGAVFIPAAGYRMRTEYYTDSLFGGYWTSTPYEYYNYIAYYMHFDVYFGGFSSNDRWYGYSVRLVTDVVR